MSRNDTVVIPILEYAPSKFIVAKNSILIGDGYEILNNKHHPSTNDLQPAW